MDKINLLLTKLGLSAALEEPKVLTGGQLHRCILVKTADRALVVKELNPFVTRKNQFPDNYEASESIANGFLEAGVRAVAAINLEGRFVHACRGSYFMIYPYVPGEVLKAKQVLPSHAAQIGNIFAHLHKIGSSMSISTKLSFDIHSTTEWEQILPLSSEWIDDHLAGHVLEWNKRYLAALPFLRKELVVSHRDLHYGNVIWDHNNLAQLIDWESAGLINPLMEIIGYGLEWSGILLGNIKAPIFRIITHEYLAASKRKCPYAEEAFYGWLGHCVLAWLFFNLNRALAKVSDDTEEIERGKAVLNGELISFLRCLAGNELSLLAEIKQVFKS